MKLEQIPLHHPRAAQLAFEVFCSDYPILLIELPSVYGLMAPNTPEGVMALNKCKKRLAGKFYGSISGNYDDLRRMTSLPPVPLASLQSFILRLKVNEPCQTAVCCNGTHQVLLENDLIKNFVSKLESLLNSAGMNNHFPVSCYAGPLCTSANISGDASGSITHLSDALTFAEDRKIPLMIHTSMLGEKTGSYPIFSYDGMRFHKERVGPSDDTLLNHLNQSLQGSE